MEKDNIKENLKEKVLEYLSRKNEVLSNDYVIFEGGNIESCTSLAVDAAKILIKEGKHPYLVYFTRKDVDGKRSDALLTPVQYNERISWRAHVACVCDGLIYDPMIGQPVPIQLYPQIAFAAEADMKMLVPADEILDFIKRTHFDLFT